MSGVTRLASCFQGAAAERFALRREPVALGVGEAQTPVAEPLAQDVVLLLEYNVHYVKVTGLSSAPGGHGASVSSSIPFRRHRHRHSLVTGALPQRGPANAMDGAAVQRLRRPTPRRS